MRQNVCIRVLVIQIHQVFASYGLIQDARQTRHIAIFHRRNTKKVFRARVLKRLDAVEIIHLLGHVTEIGNTKMVAAL